MADLQVSIALLLENQAEIATKLAAEGGKAGEAFRRSLTPAAQKAFDELVKSAEKAAKDVGVKFNSTKLQFETVKGDLIPPATLDKIAKISQGFAEARQAVDVFKSAVTTASQQSASSLNLLEAAVTGVAVSLTSRLTDAISGGMGALKGLVGNFMELDTELRSAAAAAGETGGYERLGAIVDKVGIDAAGTQKQVAELATALVKAGFSVTEVEQALPGVVRGAEATGTSFERFGDIVGSTLRQFGLEATEVDRVNDVLTNTANSTNASIEGISYSMQEAAPIAKALGITLEDTAAAVGILANAGLQGSVAGTGLKTMFQKIQQAAGGASPEILGLAHGQERLSKVMRMLGADVLDASGKMLPLDQVLLKLKSSMDQLSQGDRAALANVLFGDDAGPKFLAILNQSSSQIQKVFTDVRNSAGAVDAARDATNGFQRQLTQLTGTLDSIGISIGSVAASGLAPFLGVANQVVGAIAGMPEKLKTTAGALIAIATTAAAASVAVGALNVAVAQVGGWAAMKASIMSVASVITGPLGAGALILTGLGAAAAVLTGHFRETDRTTKTLLQTAVGLGTFVAVLRGITVAQEAWNKASKIGASIQTFLLALTPGGLAKIGVAATAAAGAYYLMGRAIKETGADTEELSNKSKSVKDEITQLDQQITEGKKLNIDTSDLEKIKADKLIELQAIEEPLEIKVGIEKAEAKIKSLKEQLDKLDKGDSKAPALDAQVKAAEKLKEVLKAAEQGTGSSAYQRLSADAKAFIQDQEKIKNEITRLRGEQIKLDPVTDKAKWDEIDKKVAELTSEASDKNIKFTATLDADQLEAKRAELQAKLSKVQTPISKGAFESNDNFAQRQAEQKEKERVITQQIYDITLKQAKAQQDATGATNEQASAADRAKKAEEERLAKKTELLQKAKDAYELEQQQIGLSDKLMENDKKRLESVRQLADAYMELAQAQGDLTQSEFDVQKADLAGQGNEVKAEMDAIKEAGDEALQSMKDRGATQDEIAAKEREIADTLKGKEEEIKALKEQQKQVEEQALSAAIQNAQKRFEMERKVLELKQMADELEARAAVRASQRAALEAKKGLAELEQKQLDPKLTEPEKAKIGDQIGMQKQIIALAEDGVAADKEALATKKQLYGMQKQTLAVQQETKANQFDAKVREDKDFRNSQQLANDVRNLKGSIPNSGQPTMKWDDIAKKADKVVGIIKDHNKELDKGTKDVSKLADAWKKASSKGSGDDQKMAPQQKPKFEGNDQARNSELEKQKKWKKEMEAAGILEFKAEGVPQRISDAIAREAITGQRAPEVDQWFNSKEGQAAMEKWRQSAAGAAEELYAIDAAAQQASQSLQNLQNEDGSFVSGDAAEKAHQDFLEASRKAMSAEGMANVPADITLRPIIDTTAADQSLDTLRQQQEQDPFQINLDTSSLDSGALEGIRGPVQDFIDQLQTTEDPFANVGSSFAEAAYGAEGIRSSLTGATEQATALSDALPDETLSTDLQQAYESLQPPDVSQAVTEQGNLASGTESTIESTQELANSWADVTTQINAAASAQAAFSTPSAPARFAGGGVRAGSDYTVNELGREAFLSASGRLSLIRAPQFGKWTAPSRGMVLPAGMTQRLEAMGAFGGHAQGPVARQVATAVSRPSQGRGDTAALSKLQRSIDRLEKTMGNYRPPDVSVNLPSNAGLLHTLQAIR